MPYQHVPLYLVPTKVIRCRISISFFHKTNKQVSIVGTYFSSLGYTTYLLVMLTVKEKIVENEHQLRHEMRLVSKLSTVHPLGINKHPIYI